MIQHPCILKNNIQHQNIEHLSKRGPPPFFHSDTNLVLGNALVHPFEKNPFLVVTVELIWLLFLNMLSFNFMQTPDLGYYLLGSENLEEAMYTALLSFKPTIVKDVLLFLLGLHCPKCPHSFFLRLFVPKDSAFT